MLSLKKISNLHDSLEKQQFNPEERYSYCNFILFFEIFLFPASSSTSQHNKEVAAGITEEIQFDPDNEYSLDMIKCKKKIGKILHFYYIVYFSGSKT